MENIPRSKIVVGIDGSSESVNALRYALGLASAMGHDLVAIASWLPRIVLKDHAPEWGPEQDAHETLDRAMEQNAHETLDKAIKQAFGANIPENLKREVVVGPAAPNLLKASKDAAMLVLGTRGRGGFKGLVMGSVSSSLAAHASCPVLIHHGEQKVLRHRAIPPLNGVAGGQGGFDSSRDLGRRKSATYWDRWWQAMHLHVDDRPVVAGFATQLRGSVPEATRLSLLRTLDIVIWMHGTYGAKPT